MSATAPPSPTSSTATTTKTAGSGSTASTTTKSRKACDHCRASKSKCEVGPSGPGGACQRCVKTQRQCIFGVRQQRKTRNRSVAVANAGGSGSNNDKVERLERKLQALEARMGGIVDNNSGGGGGTDAGEQSWGEWEVDDEDGTPTPPPIGPPDSASAVISTASPPAASAPADVTRFFYSAAHASTTPNACPPLPPPPPSVTTDLISRSVLSLELATHLYTHFLRSLYPHYPFFAIPHSAQQCRSQYPVLFTAVLTVAAGTGAADPHTHHLLLGEVYCLLGMHIFQLGRKSFELCQAIIVIITWYHPCASQPQGRLWMLVNQASIMSLELALPPPDRTERVDLEQDLEEKRVLLTCSMGITSISIALRRPIMGFGRAVPEAIEALATSHPLRTSRDMVLINFVEVMSLMAETAGAIGILATSPNDAPTGRSLTFILDSFEKRLQQQVQKVDSAIRNSPELMAHGAESIVNVFSLAKASAVSVIYGAVLESSNFSSFGTFFAQAVSTLRDAIHHILDVFTESPSESLATSPYQIFSRAVNAMRLLLKLTVIPETPITTEQLRVSEYLERTEQKLRSLLGRCGMRTVALSLALVESMRRWYYDRFPQPLPAVSHPLHPSPIPQPPPHPPQAQAVVAGLYGQHQQQRQWYSNGGEGGEEVAGGAGAGDVEGSWEIPQAEMGRFLQGVDGQVMFGSGFSSGFDVMMTDDTDAGAGAGDAYWAG